MECNKDEAERARKLAMEKISLKDYNTALKLAEKSKRLCSSLECIDHVIVVAKTLLAGEAMVGSISAESNWYGVLQVVETAEYDQIRKQFRKLALSLHPDKNNTVGADEAFKLINKAHSVLSDKAQKYAFDFKLQQSRMTPMSNIARKYQEYSNGLKSNPGSFAFAGQRFSHGGQSHQFQANQPLQISAKCVNCRRDFRFIPSQTQPIIACPHCGANHTFPSFTAHGSHGGFAFPSSQPLKTGFPQNGQIPVPNAAYSDSVPVHQSAHASRPPQDAKISQFFTQNADKKAEGKKGSKTAAIDPKSVPNSAQFVEKTGKAGEASSASANGENGVEGNVKSGTKRGAQESDIAKQAKDSVKSKNKKQKRSNHGSDEEEEEEEEAASEEEDEEDKEFVAAQTSSHGQTDTLPVRRSSRKRGNVHYAVDIDEEEDEEGLAEQKRASKVQKLSSEAPAEQAAGKQAENEQEKQPRAVNVDSGGPVGGNGAEEAEQSSANAEVIGEDQQPLEEDQQEEEEEEEEEEEYNVPDGDFYDFDEIRKETDISPGDVWAVYDGTDGMPRFYCYISDAARSAAGSFSWSIRWLELLSRDGKKRPSSRGSGPAPGCGTFRKGAKSTAAAVNVFSHRVFSKLHETARGKTLAIFPRPGEVWACFRAGNAARCNEYDPVLVLPSKDGVNVRYLKKLPGFTNVFLEDAAQQTVPQKSVPEFFSHLVPSRTCDGSENPEVEKGALLLDTAAIPPSWLH